MKAFLYPVSHNAKHFLTEKKKEQYQSTYPHAMNIPDGENAQAFTHVVGSVMTFSCREKNAINLKEMHTPNCQKEIRPKLQRYSGEKKNKLKFVIFFLQFFVK